MRRTPASLGPALAVPLVTALLLCVACPARRPQMERFHVKNRIDEGAFPDVPAVVLLDRTELVFSYSTEKKRPYAESLHTRRVQVLRPEGLELQKVRIPFDDRSRILHIQARVTKPDGRVIEMPPDRAVDLPRFSPGSPPAKLYNDDGYKLTKVSQVEVGDVMELSYVRVYRDPRWVEPIQVGGELPVVRGEVVVDHPLAYDVDFRVTRLGRTVPSRPARIPARVKGPEGDGEGVSGTRHVFVFENEPAIYPEDLRPDTEALTTQVHVALKGYTLRAQRYDAYRSWNDVARWYRELTAGKDVPDAAVKKAVLEAGGKGGSKLDKVARVQRYLQDRVADVPAFLNLAALPARAPGEILKARIGDAKDQASLGLAMLRELGVDGFPVLVSRAGSFASVPDLPSPAPFNHVVLAIPAGGTYHFIDPSTPLLPVGRMPGALQGQRGLLVRKDSAELIDLPEDDADQNTRVFTYELALSRQGTASGQLKVTLEGLDAAMARRVLKEGGDDVAARLQALLRPGEAAKLPWKEVLTVAGPGDSPDKPLKLQVILGPGPVADESDGGLALQLERLVGRPLPFLWREARRMPLVLDHPYVERKKVSVSLPDELGVASLPQETRETSPLCSVDERWAIADGVLWLDRKLRIEARTVDAAQYDVLRRPVTGLWAAQAVPVDVVPGGDRGKSYGGDPF